MPYHHKKDFEKKMKIQQSKIEDVYDGVNIDEKEILQLFLILFLVGVVGFITIVFLIKGLDLNRVNT